MSNVLTRRDRQSQSPSPSCIYHGTVPSALKAHRVRDTPISPPFLTTPPPITDHKMSSPTYPNCIHRRSSSPRPPTSIDDSSSGSSMESKANSRRRTTSFSRVRETVDRTTSNFKKRCEKKLLKMVQDHLDIPLSSDTPCGLVYHVPKIPGDHTRESIANVFNQSIDWLRGNPERGTSPFNSPNSLRPAPFKPDPLDFGTGSINSPAIRPSSFQSSAHKKSITTVEFHQREIKETNQGVIKSPGLSAPTLSRGYIDTHEQIHSLHGQERRHSLPQNDSKSRFSFHQDLEEIAAEVRPTGISGSPLQSPTLSQRYSRIQKTTITIAAKQRTNLPSPELAPSTQDDTNTNSDHDGQRPQPFQKVSIRRKPCPDIATPASRPNIAPRSPSQYLGVGLRPILPASLTIKPVVPTTATTSTEVLDRINATQSLRNPSKNPRTLSRKRNGRDLRALRLDQSDIQDALHSDPITEEPSLPVRSRFHGNVAAKISRFEEPLPSVLQAGQATFGRQTSRSHKRRGVYNPSRPVTEHQAGETKEFATKDDTKTTTVTAKPFGEFQPYRPTTQQASKSEEGLPQLPSVPRTGKGSMLREIKRELFPDTDVDLLSAASTTDSLLQAHDTVAHSNKETNTLPSKELSPRRHHLASPTGAPQLPHVPYSRSIIRKGNLNELGGRVVEIRKRFEEKKSEVSKRAMPSTSQTPPNPQERSSSLLVFTARQHLIETDMELSTSTSSHPFYNHSNGSTDNLQSTQSTMTTNPFPKPQYQPYRSQTKPGIISHSHSPAAAPLQQQPRYKPYRSSTAPLITITQYKPYRPPPPARIKTTNPQPLYTTLYQDQASRIEPNHAAIHKAISHTMDDRVQAAANEASLVQKSDHVWEWKRFTDVEWDERERERRPRTKVKARINIKHQDEDRNT